MFAPFALLLALVACRVLLGIAGMHHLDWLHNFSPVAAVALCGAVYFPKKAAIWLPLGVLLVSDIALNLAYRQPFLTVEILPRYLALGLITALGFAIRKHRSVALLVGGSVLGSLIFYVVTNTGSWLYEPGYAKTFAGWTQALTTGLPGYPSSLFFYRHTLESDLFFTALFVTCVALGNARKPVPAVVEPSTRVLEAA